MNDLAGVAEAIILDIEEATAIRQAEEPCRPSRCQLAITPHDWPCRSTRPTPNRSTAVQL